MESQQMMELLLDMKARQEENARTINEKMDANTKVLLAWREDMRADREQRKAEREADREQRKAKIYEMFAKMDRKASPERMTATQAKTDGKLKELTETIEETQTEPRVEMMQSAEEHQEVPRDDAVMFSRSTNLNIGCPS
jgi:hypothetical protein